MSANHEDRVKADPFLIIFIFVVVAIVLSSLWNSVHGYVSLLYIYIRYVEVFPLWLAGKYLNFPILNQAYNYIYDLCQPDNYSIIGWCTRNPEEITVDEIVQSSGIINFILSIVLLKKIYRYTQYIKKRHPKLLYKKEHNLDSFIAEQSVNHRHLKLFQQVDLISKDLRDPLYGMSLTVRDFCYKHQLIIGWQECDDKSFIPTLDYAKTERSLINQLGMLWTGNKLNEISRAEIILLAIAIPRVAATDIKLNDEEYKSAMDDSKKIIKKLWDYFSNSLNPDIDVSYEMNIITSYYKMSEKVRDIFSRHAYVRTIIYALITEARRLGVLSAADMGWMQFYDREMYFNLSSIGRQTAFPEACAVMCHFLYECRIGEAYPEPLVDKSIEGIKYVLTDVYKFTKEDVNNYSKIQKKS